MATTATSPDNVTSITVPPGFTVVNRNGAFFVEHNGERLTHTVAFRLPPSEYLNLLPFFESFPDGKSSIALRWLVNQPEVQAVMARQTGSVQRGSASSPAPND